MLGTDVSCPEIAAKICGRENVRMLFNHNQMRMSELYWQYSTGGVLGYMGICDQAVGRTYVGLGAIAYGAVAAAAMAEHKRPIEMQKFDRLCTMDQLQEIAPQMIGAVLSSLPKGSGEGKNAQSRRRKTTTRGTSSSGAHCAPASDTEK